MSGIDRLLQDMAWEAEEYRKAHPPPYAWYNKSGDALEVYLQEGLGIYEAVNKFVTVVVHRNDRKKVIGFVLKGITTNFRDMIEKVGIIHGPGLVNVLVFQAGALGIMELWRSPEAPAGAHGPEMSVEDIVACMKGAQVQLANPEAIEEALV